MDPEVKSLKRKNELRKCPPYLFILCQNLLVVKINILSVHICIFNGMIELILESPTV